jgi:hypothetical protein
LRNYQFYPSVYIPKECTYFTLSLQAAPAGEVLFFCALMSFRPRHMLPVIADKQHQLPWEELYQEKATLALN